MNPSVAQQVRDGCTCPPWVIRCVHRADEEAVLVLASGDGLYSLHPPHPNGNDWREGGYSHAVYFISSTETLPCSCGCGTAFAAGINLPRSRHTSEADALAAFYAAEEELLRGVA